MRRIKFTGVRPTGTLKPRRMWLPREEVNVDDDVAKENSSAAPGSSR